MQILWAMKNTSNQTIRLAEHFFKLRSAWLGAGGHPVSPKDAQARADVCLKCPLNEQRTIYELFVGAAAKFVKDQIEYKNNLKLRVNGEKDLHICGACKCVLRLKVHVPIKFIKETTTPEVMSELAPECWIPKEINDNENHRIPEQ